MEEAAAATGVEEGPLEGEAAGGSEGAGRQRPLLLPLHGQLIDTHTVAVIPTAPDNPSSIQGSPCGFSRCPQPHRRPTAADT